MQAVTVSQHALSSNTYNLPTIPGTKPGPVYESPMDLVAPRAAVSGTPQTTPASVGAPRHAHSVLQGLVV